MRDAIKQKDEEMRVFSKLKEEEARAAQDAFNTQLNSKVRQHLQVSREKDEALRLASENYQAELLKKDQELRSAFEKFKSDIASTQSQNLSDLTQFRNEQEKKDQVHRTSIDDIKRDFEEKLKAQLSKFDQDSRVKQALHEKEIKERNDLMT